LFSFVREWTMAVLAQTGNRKIIYYKDCDLSVGSIINIFNRKFVLYDADEFTKEYYRVKYGISECFSAVTQRLGGYSINEFGYIVNLYSASHGKSNTTVT